MAEELQPIAIIGLAFKFPQDTTSEAAFWQMLCEGRSASTEFPPDRLNIDAYYHPDESRPSTIPLRGGNFIKEDLSKFDAPFFSITPGEAACMDPQHRFMLETTYHALEDAGIPISRCSGSDTSVYTGCFTNDYLSILQQDYEAEQRHAAMGIAPSMLANRLSWFYDFKGTSMNLDSACSSSLVALHLACQDLRLGTSSMSLVGGANLVYHPNFMKMMSDFNFLSKDSRCWSFDTKANGYARGEGFAMLVLKRLPDALRDGDTIRAVVRNTGSNQDGRTPGITQPSRDAQVDLIRKTYKQGNIEMEPTRYFEAHGTGTPIGDPVEANAIAIAFKQHRTSDDPLYIGAVKANIGHLEGASGLAGIVKTVMVLENGVIPPIAGFEKLNEQVDPGALHLHFPKTVRSWPTSGLRRACINSFGFGGTNATAILDDACHYLEQHGLNGHHRTHRNPLEEIIIEDRTKYVNGDTSQLSDRPRLLIWSAPEKRALGITANAHLKYLAQRPEKTQAVVYALSARRSNFTYRCFSVIQHPKAIDISSVSISAPVKINSHARSAFIFTGQGAQYVGMGEELLEYRAYKASLEASQQCLAALGCQWSISTIMKGLQTRSDISAPEYSQPLTTILQLGLVDLLESLNVAPTVVIGHSSGEIAAAYASGALTRQSAVKIAYHRGVLSSQLMRNTSQELSMMAVALPRSEILPYFAHLETLQGRLDVAIGCVNSSKSLTLTGDLHQLIILERLLKEDSVFTRRLRVPMAYHSRFMETIAHNYANSIQDLEPRVSAHQVLMISSVTGDIVATSTLNTAAYWVQNLTSTVEFAAALQKLIDQSLVKPRKKLGRKVSQDLRISHILEVGPHSALQAPIREILQDSSNTTKPTYITTLMRGRDACETLLSALGSLYCAGYEVDVTAANQLKKSSLTLPPDLPKYPFDHTRSYWRESRLSRNMRFPQRPRHDLLGTRSLDWNDSIAQWRNTIRLAELHWLEDHRINGDIIFPAAAMIVMAMEALVQLLEDDPSHVAYGMHLSDVTFLHPIAFLLGVQSVEVQTTLEKDLQGESQYRFKLFVIESEKYVQCCTAHIRPLLKKHEPLDAVNGATFLQGTSCRDWVEKILGSTSEHSETDPYALFTGSKVEYGPTFQNLKHVRLGSAGIASADLDTGTWKLKNAKWPNTNYLLHPVVLDGLAQVLVPALHQEKSRDLPTMVPSSISNMWLNFDRNALCEDQIRMAARCKFRGHRGASANIIALSPALNTPLVVLHELRTTFIGSHNEHKVDNQRHHLCTRLIWKPDLGLMNSQQIFQYCSTSRPKQAENAVRSYKSLMTAIMCFVVDAVHFLDQTPGLSLSPHMESYVLWLRYQTTLMCSGESPVSHERVLNLLKDPDARNTLIHNVEASGVDGHFFMYLGKNIRPILEGTVDPLALMFGDGLADRYYEAMLANEHHAHPASAYIDLACFKDPSMKIFEVGAGTGGQTLRLLERMSAGGVKRWERYDYTDVSPVFFGPAQEKFKDYIDRIHFRVCDISNDPKSQGFEIGTYDIVVASHVLHATNDLQQSLHNVRKLLKPNGKLLLFETTVPEAIPIGFAFGLLQGWWNPLTHENRSTLSPCLTTKAWHDSLQSAGFSGVDVELPGQEELECRYSSIIISTAVEKRLGPTALENCSAHSVLVIANHCITTQHADAVSIQTGLQKLQFHCEVATLEEFAASRDAPPGLIISLLEVDNIFLNEMSEDEFTKIQNMLLRARSILWVTRDKESWSEPRHHLIDGLGRVMMSEDATRKFAKLSVNGPGPLHRTILDAILRLVESMAKLPVEQLENNYTATNNVLHISRVTEYASMNERVAKAIAPRQRIYKQLKEIQTITLGIERVGHAESIGWFEHNGPKAGSQLADDEVLIDVRAIGLTDLDAHAAAGSVDETNLGYECAGIVLNAGSTSELYPGQRVCVLHHCSGQSHICVPSSAAITIPDDMSFPVAASLPFALWSAYHALVRIAHVENGEIVLIHHAHSCVGQMAAQVAVTLGAIVLLTTDSQDRSLFLQQKLGVARSSVLVVDDSSIFKEVYHATNGRKPDVVIGAFADELAEEMAGHMAPFGRLINVEPLNSRTYSRRRHHEKNLIVATVDLASLLREDFQRVSKTFQAAMRLGLQAGMQSPGPLHLFDASVPANAFSHLMELDVFGKRVIELDPQLCIPATVSSNPRYLFPSDATYVIAGGLGGLGRSFARWMVSRGAQNLILISRFGVRSEAAKHLVEELRERGVRVVTPAVDISLLSDLRDVFDAANKCLPPIRGCIQATVALRDNLFENMTYEDWRVSTGSKVAGSWNLHATLPAGLDFFILLSSLNGIFGGRAQANYAAGNTYKDALAHYRLEQGERAVSIDLGLMVNEGVVAENEHLLKSMRRIGHLMDIRQEELIALLDMYCDIDQSAMSHEDVQILVGVELPAAILEKGIDLHHSIQRPLFRHLFQMNSRSTAGPQTVCSRGRISRPNALKESKSLDEAAEQVTEWFSAKVAQVLGVRMEDIDGTKAINVYGIDSLVAIDLKNWMHREIGANVEVFILLANISLQDLCREVVKKSSFVKELE
ncbi:lovastatin nonaketide synthase [Phaeosphaeria sp. MPI-PUGE-AT-0046c]|nr:lovastatin nonaketide synthase [Phaeosphaeria sp. MPI-PUGE-AT-0046c]